MITGIISFKLALIILDFENELIKKLNAKRFLKHIIKVNDVSALRYAIIKLKSEEYKVWSEYIIFEKKYIKCLRVLWV